MYRSLKGYLGFAALAVIIAFLIYSQYMARELESETTTISRIYGKFCASAAEDETSVIFDEIITKINFPVIVTSPTGEIISSRNVDSPTPQLIQKLDREHEPVKIKYEGNLLAQVHYGDSRIRKLLKFAPIAEIVLGALLIIIGIIWLYTLKKSEENALFAGIAKETAHQLGTPISSLMGWKELIKDKEIKSSFQEDLNRLSAIATRFHKIGSQPEFQLQPIDKVIKSTVTHIRERISKKIDIIEDYSDHSQVKLAPELFSWAIENLIKNSADAESTQIKISTKASKQAKIIVSDNGKGIPKNSLKKIFSPGYTTKEYGWGMGLSLARRIISMHHGKIHCKPNKSGSTFIISLPLKRT